MCMNFAASRLQPPICHRRSHPPPREVAQMGLALRPNSMKGIVQHQHEKPVI
jgi:hypothetical protein